MKRAKGKMKIISGYSFFSCRVRYVYDYLPTGDMSPERILYLHIYCVRMQNFYCTIYNYIKVDY